MKTIKDITISLIAFVVMGILVIVSLGESEISPLTNIVGLLIIYGLYKASFTQVGKQVVKSIYRVAYKLGFRR